MIQLPWIWLSISAAISALAMFLGFRRVREIESSSDRCIIITGCDSGIGLELAKYFHQTTKFKIIATFIGPPDRGGHKELLELQQSSSLSRLILINVDVRKAEDIQRFVKLLDDLRGSKQIEQVHALINNAGVLVMGDFDWQTWDHIQWQIDVNLTGTIRMTRAVLPYIIKGRGRVIFVSSLAATTLFPCVSIYSATKAAVNVFSRNLGYELDKFGCKTCVMHLGALSRLTEITKGFPTLQNQMWAAMPTEKRQIYGEYFNKLRATDLNNSNGGPLDFNGTSLHRNFRKAVLAESPPSAIEVVDCKLRLVDLLTNWLPMNARYRVLDKMIQYAIGVTPQMVTSKLNPSSK